MKHLISLGMKYVRRQKLRTLLTFLCVTLSVFILATFGAYCGSILRTFYNQEVSDSGCWEAGLVRVVDKLTKAGKDTSELVKTIDNHPTVAKSFNYYFESVFADRESSSFNFFEFDDGKGMTIVDSVGSSQHTGDPELNGNENEIEPREYDIDGYEVPLWLKDRGYKVGDIIDFTIRMKTAVIDEDSETMKAIRSELKEKYGTSVLKSDPEWRDLSKEERKNACELTIGEIFAEKGIEYKDYPLTNVQYSGTYSASVKIAAFNQKLYKDGRYLYFTRTGGIDPLFSEAEKEIGGFHQLDSYVTLNRNMDFDDSLLLLCKDLGYTMDDYYDAPPDVHSSLLQFEFRSADAIVGLIGFIIPFLFFLMLFWLVSRFVIDNAFEISAAERSTQYAALRIMGASKGQIAAVVLTEAVFYTITAVPAGTVAAYLLCRMSINKFRSMGFRDFEFSVNKWVTLLVIGLCVIAIFISAYTSSMWATRKLSPSEALNFGKPKSSKKKLRQHKSKLKLGSRRFISRYTKKNIMRSKNRFIIATITMTIGVVLFTTSIVTAILAVVTIKRMEDEMPTVDYCLYYDTFDPELSKQAEKVFNNDKVFSRTVIRSDGAHQVGSELCKELDKYMPYHCFGHGPRERNMVSQSAVTKKSYDEYFADLTGISYEEFAKKDGGFLISSIYGSRDGRSVNDSELLNGLEQKYEAGAVVFDNKVEVGVLEYGDRKIELAGTICCGNAFYSEGTIIYAADSPSAAAYCNSTNIFLTVNGSQNQKQAYDIIDRFMLQNPTALGMFDDEYVFGTGRQDFMLAIAKTIAALVFSIWMVGVLSMVNSINTSVLNRSRELMMLRSVGMTKKQLRKTVFQESVTFSSVSSVSGVVLGILLVVFVCRLLDFGTEFMVPAIGAIGAAVAAIILLNTVIALIAAIPGIRSLERAEALTKAF